MVWYGCRGGSVGQNESEVRELVPNGDGTASLACPVGASAEHTAPAASTVVERNKRTFYALLHDLRPLRCVGLPSLGRLLCLSTQRLRAVA